MRLPAILCIALSLAACHKAEQEAKPPTAENQAAPEAGPVKGVDRRHRGDPAPSVTFNAPDGGSISMAKFKGVPVLVNLWASWCAPCIKELPTLDRLAAQHRDDGQLGVIAVSQDSGTRASVEAFLAKLKVKDLGAYQDPKMALSGALGAEILPTSILYDADGKEVWRYVGDLDWSGTEAAKLLAEADAGQKPR